MAEAALPRRGADIARAQGDALDWVIAHWQTLAFAAIVTAAAVLRLWDLGSRALHHDESLHATFSWYFFKGRGYSHDPLMHGPFQFHMNALAFFLFGDSDFTARLPHALFGTSLVAMPYLLRKQIGMKAVLIASALLAVSPTVLFFSRFDREDIYTAVWTFAMVICLWRYLDEQKMRWLYGLAAAMALAFATKEVTFMTVAVLLLFLDLMLAVDLGKRREGETIDGFSVFARTVVIAPAAWLIAALWPLLGTRPFGRERLPAAGDALIVMGTLSLPQFAAAIQVLPFVGNKGYKDPREDSLRIASVLVLLIFAVYIGLLWRPKQWAITAAFFFVPFVLLFTTFFTNTEAPWQAAFWHPYAQGVNGKDGLWSGIWGSLDYWLAQHDVKRGDQPIYYYLLVTPLYEFLPLLLVLGGGVWMVIKGTAFRRGLLFWLVGIFIGLSVAGEKMPWLETHIALPLIIAAAVVLARAIDVLDFSPRRWAGVATIAGASVIATLLLVENDSTITRVAGLILAGGVAGALPAALIGDGPKAAGRVALTVAVAALFTLTVRASYVASFEHGDIPVEMLVYTQTSPDIPEIRDRIDVLAKKSGLGLNLPIVVDGQDGFAWPWAWYLRDYHNVAYPSITAPGFKPPDNAVLLINRSDVNFVDATGYSQTPYKHRWWFLEEGYRDLRVASCPPTPAGATLPAPCKDVLSILTSLDDLRGLGDFFLYRRSVAKTGSVDAVAFFPQTLAAFDVNQPPPKPAPEPAILGDGRIVIGRVGSSQGELAQPADVFVDHEGSIWVADSHNNRVQKFDSTGHFLAVLRPGPGVPMNEPWSVAVDPEGFVYVADTWNHRILKFSPALQLLKAWGEPAVRPSPGPLELFGPRDIAFAPDGTLWVSDTGNERLINYNRDGQPLGVYGSSGGGAGQFQEPVGIDFDASGSLYVADTWNGRIQKLGPGLVPAGELAAGWTSHEVTAKPYLAVLQDGRVLASEPSRGVLMLFGKDGKLAGTWKPEGDALPLGVAATADGGFVFADGRNGFVEVVPGEAVARLFH